MIRLLVILFALLLSLYGGNDDFVFELKQKVEMEYKKEYPSIEIYKVEIDSPPITKKDGYQLRSSYIQKQNLERNNGILFCVFAKKMVVRGSFFEV